MGGAMQYRQTAVILVSFLWMGFATAETKGILSSETSLPLTTASKSFGLARVGNQMLITGGNIGDAHSQLIGATSEIYTFDAERG